LLLSAEKKKPPRGRLFLFGGREGDSNYLQGAAIQLMQRFLQFEHAPNDAPSFSGSTKSAFDEFSKNPRTMTPMKVSTSLKPASYW
jgi:hypothetical protein